MVAQKDHITGNQRDIPLCLAELLDTQLSSGWVNGQFGLIDPQTG